MMHGWPGTLLAVLIMGAIAAFLYFATRPRAPKKMNAAELRDELDRLTHDPEVSERLIERMRKQYPELGKAGLLRRAIAELRADRRR